MNKCKNHWSGGGEQGQPISWEFSALVQRDGIEELKRWPQAISWEKTSKGEGVLE